MRFGHRPAPPQRHGPLERVLEAEQAGAAEIAAARREADAWLAGEKHAIRQAADAELAAMEADHQRDIAAAKDEAESQAAAIIDRANVDAAALQALADEDLASIVARHVRRLLPGGAP